MYSWEEHCVESKSCYEHVTDTMELPNNYCMSGTNAYIHRGVVRDECAVPGAERIKHNNPATNRPSQVQVSRLTQDQPKKPGANSDLMSGLQA